MTQARIDFNVDDLSEADLRVLVARLSPVLAATSGSAWEIDCSDAGYLGPLAAVMLASAWHMASVRNQRPAIRLPQSPPRLAAFCAFSGLEQLVRGTSIPDAQHPRNETVPLQRFDRANWGASAPIVQLVRRHAPRATEDSEELLRMCYSEIAQNVEDHASSPVGGLMSVRWLSSKKEIRIAVADLGLGIGATLRRAGHDADDQEALRLVLAGDVSSRSRRNNMGQGISNLALIAAGNNGHVVILSGSGMASVSHSRPEPRVDGLDPGFPGTAVVLSLRVDESPASS